MSLSAPTITEQRNPATAQIDQLPTDELCRLINRQDAVTPLVVAEVVPRIAEAVEVCSAALAAGHRVFYLGAGTSGRLGVLDASELLPTFGLEPGRVVALIAGGDQALRHSIEAAEDRMELGRADLEKHEFVAGDVVIGIAASGRTPYVIGAMQYAKQLGATTVAVVCSPASPMADLADIAIEAIPGPEVITGSTRMKAGTVQKMILNLLSTASMIKLGKVYSNWMVDVQVTNEKLRQRAVRIVSESTGLDHAAAREMLTASGGQVKVAIISGLLGCSTEEARAKLDAAGGVIRRAVEG